MSLFIFLVITLILCSLILMVQAGESKPIKYFAVVAIALEVLLLLMDKGTVDAPSPLSLEMVIPCITGALGLMGLFKMSERSIPLLIFFASLLQFFMETDIIESIK